MQLIWLWCNVCVCLKLQSLCYFLCFWSSKWYPIPEISVLNTMVQCFPSEVNGWLQVSIDVDPFGTCSPKSLSHHLQGWTSLFMLSLWAAQVLFSVYAKACKILGNKALIHFRSVWTYYVFLKLFIYRVLMLWLKQKKRLCGRVIISKHKFTFSFTCISF